jgi:hypothetical protein
MKPQKIESGRNHKNETPSNQIMAQEGWGNRSNASASQQGRPITLFHQPNAG